MTDSNLWTHVDNVSQLKLGDCVRGTTGTHSQKWLREGYEDYNDTKTGYVVSMENTDSSGGILSVRIMGADGVEVFACVDPGTSGYYYLEKFVRQS